MATADSSAKKLLALILEVLSGELPRAFRDIVGKFKEHAETCLLEADSLLEENFKMKRRLALVDLFANPGTEYPNIDTLIVKYDLPPVDRLSNRLNVNQTQRIRSSIQYYDRATMQPWSPPSIEGRHRVATSCEMSSFDVIKTTGPDTIRHIPVLLSEDTMLGILSDVFSPEDCARICSCVNTLEDTFSRLNFLLKEYREVFHFRSLLEVEEIHPLVKLQLKEVIAQLNCGDGLSRGSVQNCTPTLNNLEITLTTEEINDDNVYDCRLTGRSDLVVLREGDANNSNNIELQVEVKVPPLPNSFANTLNAAAESQVTVQTIALQAASLSDDNGVKGAKKGLLTNACQSEVCVVEKWQPGQNGRRVVVSRRSKTLREMILQMILAVYVDAETLFDHLSQCPPYNAGSENDSDSVARSTRSNGSSGRGHPGGLTGGQPRRKNVVEFVYGFRGDLLFCKLLPGWDQCSDSSDHDDPDQEGDVSDLSDSDEEEGVESDEHSDAADADEPPGEVVAKDKREVEPAPLLLPMTTQQPAEYDLFNVCGPTGQCLAREKTPLAPAVECAVETDKENCLLQTNGAVHTSKLQSMQFSGMKMANCRMQHVV